jgi:hypothetical protein
MRMSLLYEIPSSVIVVCLFGVLMLTADIGFRFGRRTRAKLTEYDGANLRTLQSSLLWLMGLLLAFAFSMSAARHKANQELVFREANLLHAILMDARVLPAPQRGRLRQLLKQYADARLEFFFARRDLPHVYAAVNRTAQLHSEMVDLIQTEALRVPPPLGTQATLGRLNDEWGLLRERTGVFEIRVPDEVFFLLFVACCLGMALIGFGTGMAQRRETLGTVLFGILLCSTIYVVLDLDRPRRGLIDVSQTPMLGFKEAVQSEMSGHP